MKQRIHIIIMGCLALLAGLLFVARRPSQGSARRVAPPVSAPAPVADAAPSAPTPAATGPAPAPQPRNFERVRSVRPAHPEQLRSGSDALELARFGRDEVLRRRGESVAFNHPSYGASFDPKGVRVALPFAIESIGRPALALSFDEARVGDRVLARASRVEPSLDEASRSVSYPRGVVEERYALRDAGVEQLFVVRELPERGALTVTSRVETRLDPPAEGTSAARLSFGHRGTELLAMSHAVAIDAVGRRETLPLRYSAGTVSMTASADWIASAALPITIDPLIGGPIVVDPRLRDAITSVHGLAVRVADAAALPDGGWLVAWSEPVGASDFDFDVLAQRLSSTGARVGSAIPVGSGASGDYEPALSAGGDRVLVAWRQDPSNNGLETDQRIRGRVLRVDGTFVTDEFTVGDAPGQDFAPSAAFDGARWYVSWTERVSATDSNARGRFVSRDGQPENAADADVEADLASRPTAAFVDGRWVIAWEKQPAGGVPGIQTRTMDASGSFTSAVLQVSQTSRAARHAEVAAGSGRALIVWHERSAAGDWDLFGRQVTSGLEFAGGAFPIEQRFQDQATPRAAYHPGSDEFVVVYTDPVRGRRDVFAHRVSGAGIVAPAERITRDGQSDLRPEVAVNADTHEALVVFLHRERGPFQLRARRLGLEAGAPPTPGTPVGAPNPNALGNHEVTWLPASGSGLIHDLERSPDGGLAFVPGVSTTSASFTEPGLPEGSYVYRVRSRTSGGAVSAWSGLSLPVVVDRTAPPVPAGLGQWRTDGLTAIPVGGATTESGLIFRAELADGATRVRLEVEVKPIGTPFDGLGLHAGLLAESGPAELAVTLPEGSYRWRARAVDEVGNAGPFAEFGGNGEGDIDVVMGPSVPPPAPGTLSALAGAAQVTLGWTAVAGADGYSVKRAETVGGPYLTIAGPLSGTSHVDTGLMNGRTYFYVVAALNLAGEGPLSPEASATPEAVPAAPGGLAARPGDAQVTLTWSAIEWARTYTVKRAVGAGAFEALAAGLLETTYTDRTARNGTLYRYAVSGTSAGGEGPDSVPAEATPMARPAPPVLTAAGREGAVELSWTLPEGATSSSVYRSTSAGGPYVQVASGLAGSSHIDAGLSNGMPYYHVVTVSNVGGESGYSNETMTVPLGPPLDAPLITTPSGATNDPTPLVQGTGPAGSTLRLSILQGGVVLATVETTVGGDGAWSVVTPLLADGVHGFIASASMPGQVSPDSNLVVLTIDTVAPRIMSIRSPGPDGVYGVGSSIEVILTFSEPVALTGGELRVTLDVGVTLGIPAFASAGTVSATYLVALGQGSPDLTVTAIELAAGASLQDAAGNAAMLQLPTGANLGDLQDILIDTSSPVLPPPVISEPSDGATLSTRTPTVMGTSSAEGLDIQLFVEGILMGTAASGAGGVWSISISPPLVDGTYGLQAKAVNETATSGFSNLVTIEIRGPVSDPPLPPAQVRTTNYSNAVDVHWSPSPSPGVVGYRVYRKAAQAAEWPLEPLHPRLVQGTRYRDETAQPNEVYVYRVTAVR